MSPTKVTVSPHASKLTSVCRKEGRQKQDRYAFRVLGVSYHEEFARLPVPDLENPFVICTGIERYKVIVYSETVDLVHLLDSRVKRGILGEWVWLPGGHGQHYNLSRKSVRVSYTIESCGESETHGFSSGLLMARHTRTSCDGSNSHIMSPDGSCEEVSCFFMDQGLRFERPPGLEIVGSLRKLSPPVKSDTTTQPLSRTRGDGWRAGIWVEIGQKEGPNGEVPVPSGERLSHARW